MNHVSNGSRDPPAKIGDQMLKSMASLGLEELRNAVYPSSDVAQHATEPGIYGDRNYGDVAADRLKESGRERQSLLADKIKQVELAHGGREREPQDLSRE